MKRLIMDPFYDTSSSIAKRELRLVDVDRPFLGLLGSMNRKQLRDMARKKGVRRGRDDKDTRNNLTWYFYIQTITA